MIVRDERKEEENIEGRKKEKEKEIIFKVDE